MSLKTLFKICSYKFSLIFGHSKFSFLVTDCCICRGRTKEDSGIKEMAIKLNKRAES